MRRFLTPGWILSHLFVAAMVVLMVNLGFWQLRRLDDRRVRNDVVREAMAEAPRDLLELLAAPAPSEHTPVLVRGRYLDEHSFLVANRTFESQPGSWLVTPVELADGSIVAVSRGWVPRLWAAGEDSRDLTAPRGDVEILGRIFADVGGGRIGTSDVAVLPEISRLDLARVRELTGIEVVPLWVQLDLQAPPQDEIPVPVPPASLDEGPHLSYAFQWFFFSSATVVVYALILRRSRREPDDGGELLASQ